MPCCQTVPNTTCSPIEAMAPCLDSLLAGGGCWWCWLQAAEAGDVAAAQQLWSSLQAVGLKPSHAFMNGFLM